MARVSSCSATATGSGATAAIRASLGQTIDVNARPATIVGVLAGDFRHVEASPEREADLFLPYQFETVNANRGGHFIRAVGRLRAGATVEQANAELVAIATRLEREHPDENTNRGVAVRGLHAAMVADTRPALLLLSAAVGFVLLVACANLANLLLAHGASRRTELAVRAALGAGRRRLMRLMLIESVLLSALGAVAGIVVALMSTRALTALGAAGVPRAGDITVDGACPRVRGAREHRHGSSRGCAAGAGRCPAATCRPPCARARAVRCGRRCTGPYANCSSRRSWRWPSCC